jgi:hypothetical protein
MFDAGHRRSLVDPEWPLRRCVLCARAHAPLLPRPRFGHAAVRP